MKPGPDSIGAFPLTRLCGGVAAQACCLADMEPFKIAETVKDRPSWLPDCRKLEILASFSADRGGVVELVHTQMYAPTVLYVPWEFWSLRYTCCMEDGSLVVCERSLAVGQGVQDMPITPGFARAEMLTSEFLIRPYEQGVSMVVVVDDMNFKSGSLLEGFQPLYDTSVILAKKATCRALSYLRSLVKEKAEVSNPSSSLRGLSHRLVRGFNDAVNCFPDEGWVSVINSGPNTLSVHINPTSHSKQLGGNESGIVTKGGIVCVKASLVLHDTPPSLLLCFLKEKWTTWAEFDMDLGYANSRIFANDLSKKKFSTVQKLQPLVGQEEVVEFMRVQESDVARFNGVFTPDKFLLQVCNNSEEVKPGECVQLICAPIDASMSEYVALLPSGFRILHLNSIKEKLMSSQTLDLASSLEYGKTEMINSQSAQGSNSVLNIVFQFLYKPENHDIIVPNAQHHVQAIVELLQHAALSLRSPPPPPLPLPVKSGMEHLILVQQIVESYRSYIGRELLSSPPGDAEAMFKSFWSLKDSIVCCAWKPLPQFIFANRSALEMLETDLVALRSLPLEQMFNDGNRNSDYSQPPPFVLKEGYACLPSGICLSSKGNPVSFDRATGWKVITSDQSVQVGALMFCNWSVASVHM
uniref:Class III HD-Zip protein HDZ32 n=1 Tax=Marsilea minuta TaxID=388479 RepID=Q0Q422_MARMB|nr:class III HD-Zip protein HDZ32 [Marsilea minuta]